MVEARKIIEANPVEARNATNVAAPGETRWGPYPYNPSNNMTDCIQYKVSDMCVLSTFQNWDMNAFFVVYDGWCNQPGYTGYTGYITGWANEYIAIDSELPWTVDLTWPDAPAAYEWGAAPDLAYSTFFNSGYDAPWVPCDGTTNQFITCLIPFTC